MKMSMRLGRFLNCIFISARFVSPPHRGQDQTKNKAMDKQRHFGFDQK